MKKTKLVKPYGMLYSQGREYFLLSPQPIPKDSWQGDNAYMFLVVPRKLVGVRELGLSEDLVYPQARHIVTNAFVAEYVDGMPEITILDSEQETV
jgi:hypothetical protein